MHHTISRRDRLRYWFDNTMSRGPVALIAWLFLVSVLVIAVLSGVVVALGLDPDRRGFIQVAWAGLMRTLDAGTMGGDEGSWTFLLVMLLITLAGIFIVSTLIGILTTGIEAKLDELRKGRSFVAERNHTVILGWSPQIFTVLSELIEANQNQRRPVVAVLAEMDAVEMQDEIASRIPDPRNTRIVVRNGSPIDPADLEIVNPEAARSVVILAPETDDPDPHVIKVILALTNASARPEGHRYHIVASLREKKNFDVARMVGRDEVQLVLAGELIARVTAQTCRQSGLSVAYTELLDFGGDEIYFKHEPSLAGKTFGDALFAYADSAVIGLRFADGRIQLNPPMDTPLGAQDRVIAISADDDTIRLSSGPAAPVDEEAIRTATPREQAPERTLVLGWNDRAGTIVGELDNYVGAGSIVQVVADRPSIPEAPQSSHVLPARTFQNLRVYFRPGDTSDREVLDGLKVETYDHIIVLSDVHRNGHGNGHHNGHHNGSAVDPQQADARTLITLLHLRDIADRLNQDFSIVSEMLDIRNRELADATRADDFIVSDKLISLLLSQVSENRELAAVFTELFSPEGSEIYLKPAGDYVQPGREVDFYTVLESARRQGQIAIGYRLCSQAFDHDAAYGVKLNPRKGDRFALAAEDKVIVLADA
jgi:voltage-gated potassium channel Kch